MEPQETQETSLSIAYMNIEVNFDMLSKTTISEKMEKVLKQAKLYSKNYDEPILLIGMSGCGKNMLAQAMHRHKKEYSKIFYEVNCSSIPPLLFESELFGHVKGAYTGAISDKKGLFETASEGTIFLDELAELPLDLQAKLLHVIERKQFFPIGSEKPTKTEAYIICATNKSKDELRNPKIFRQDLYYRMLTCISVPSLKERGEEDITNLIDYFINSYSQKAAQKLKKSKVNISIDSDVLKKLKNYSWPGNVRELKNAIKLAVYTVIANGETEIKMEHLPEELFHDDIDRQFDIQDRDRADIQTIDKVVEDHIKNVWNSNKSKGVKKVAEILGISPQTLYRRLNGYHKSYCLEMNKKEGSYDDSFM